MISKDGITKEHSKMLYGLAIIMMIYHHLFCIPSRIDGGYIHVIDVLLDSNYIGLRIAWFCKMCVAIYAFISGYGIASKCVHSDTESWNERIGTDYKCCIKHIGTLYKKYWIVFLILIPYGLISSKLIFGGVKTFILNVLGLQATYNEEWWYVRQYLLMLIGFPFVNLFIDKALLMIGKNKRVHCLISIILLALIGIIYVGGFEPIRSFLNTIVAINSPLIVYSVIFCEGIYCEKMNIFVSEEKCIQTNRREIAIMILLIIVVARVLLASSAWYCFADIFLTIPLIYSVCILIEYSKIARILKWFGKYSTYIWLTHTFYCYYYFQKIITLRPISVYMFLVTIILSVVTAAILIKIEKYINSVIKSISSSKGEEI